MFVLELEDAMSTYIQFSTHTQNRGLALTYVWVCIFYNLGFYNQSLVTVVLLLFKLKEIHLKGKAVCIQGAVLKSYIHLLGSQEIIYA